MTAPAGPGERRVQIETPEHVRIGYELADLGSRFLALFLDLVLFGVALFVIGVAVPFLLSRFALFESLMTLGFAVVLMAIMLGFWAYFSLFEGLAGGRTPGKRLAGLRVIHEARAGTRSPSAARWCETSSAWSTSSRSGPGSWAARRC